MQREELYSCGYEYMLKIDTDLNGYKMFRKNKVFKSIGFYEIGYPDLVFIRPNNSILRFSNEGAPINYFSVVVKNKIAKNISRKIEVQPITGRVVISNG